MDTPQENSEFVPVAEFLDPAEAQMAKSALEAEGIDVFLQGENANNLVPMAYRTRLLVSKQNEADARVILESAETAGPEGDAAA